VLGLARLCTQVRFLPQANEGFRLVGVAARARAPCVLCLLVEEWLVPRGKLYAWCPRPSSSEPACGRVTSFMKWCDENERSEAWLWSLVASCPDGETARGGWPLWRRQSPHWESARAGCVLWWQSPHRESARTGQLLW
jgi:hypothetical protein